MPSPPAPLLTTAAVALTAAIGSAGTDPSSRWYRRLDKPSWQPPGAAFGVIWTTLYALLSLAGARALNRAAEHDDPGARGRYTRAYAANLALNAGWTWTFFRAERPKLAVAESAVLAASTADLARRSWQLDRTAGAALVPYAAWTSFATVLSAEIARRNPGA